MRTIQPDLTEELEQHFKDPKQVSAGIPFPVNTFRELVEIIAKLSFKNKDYLLFYRGQKKDYLNKNKKSTFYPTIYREEYLTIRELKNRFEILEETSIKLTEVFEKKKVEGYNELKKRRSIQWSILQHYEVCPTPFLDLTQSLRVACSFATINNSSDEAFIYAFGMPYFTNRISINSEHDIQNIRLLSICPPTALRPYFQEGYVVSTYDITTNYESKTDLDFNNRLIAKFKIPNKKSFWGKEFYSLSQKTLYPENDPIDEICKHLKTEVDKGLKSGDLGEFIKLWAELEGLLNSSYERDGNRYIGIRNTMSELFKQKILDEEVYYKTEMLRKFRNILVHKPMDITPSQVRTRLVELENIINYLKKLK